MGTTKICAIAAELKDSDFEVIGIGTSESRGLRKGIVVNIEATVESISEAVRRLEEQASLEVESVYVGIAGGHIKSFESYGTAPVKGSEITKEDIDRALEAAKAVYVPLDREVLHVIPKEFVVDGEEGIINPVGMNGIRLEAKVQIVTGSVSAVQNLLKCCEKAGLEVIDIVLEPLASSLATLTDQEREHGVVMIDIGGGTTDIAFYKNGVLSYTSVIAIGGNHITNDIAIGLRLPVDEAERLKKTYGSVLPEGENEEIKIMVAGRQQQSIPKSYLTEIIYPRCEELFELIKTELINTGAYEEAVYGVVITGGASLLNGMERLAEAVLGMPVRKGIPHNRGLLKDVLSDPKYSTGMGLLLYGAETEVLPVNYGDVFSNILKRMKQWVKGWFGS